MSVDYEDEFAAVPSEPSLAERRAAVQDMITPFDLDQRDGGVDGMLGAQITRWRDMPDEDAPEAWDQLRAFVDWLVPRYELSSTVVPGCWFRHPVVVEELSALRAAWDASFVVETDGGLGPIGWHERFSLTLDRLQKYGYMGECTRSGHIDTPFRDVAVDEDDWDQRRNTA